MQTNQDNLRTKLLSRRLLDLQCLCLSPSLDHFICRSCGVYADTPPSTLIIAALTNDAAGVATKSTAAAISSTEP
jgi:hypothetical protein